jgi:predicted DNA-binding transcriptional regulator AlpA
MKLLKDTEAAAFLGVKDQTVRTWRSKNIGPKYIRISRNIIRYRSEDLEAYLAARIIEPDQPDLNGK